MNKLKEIIDGWYNDANPTPEILAMAEPRAKICSECPENIFNICKSCGCPLSKKTKSPTSKCPKNKW